VLTMVSLLVAPLCPFMADVMWRALTGADEDDSVHLADWPVADATWIDPDLEAQMALARRLTSLGRAARGEASIKVRQPLARALVFLPGDAPAILRDIVADELNVDEIDEADELGDVLEFELIPNFRTLGPRLGERVKDLKPALAALDGVVAADALESGGTVAVNLGGDEVTLGPDDVQLRVRGQQGFAVSREGGEVVALDLTLNDDLRQRGLAREVVRLLQDLRKASGLEVSDRIELHMTGLDGIASFFDYIAGEVLAVGVMPSAGEGDGTALDLDAEDVGPVTVWLRKAAAAV
jgi:isoleucyl-tRNA synthetase